ncbi:MULTISPECIES: exopolysaccharide biosynthesis polyprenyl glycosylphosphotransferase [unclassified Bradyrhizobium]|uniref:exopolysaccharide biosynthesis polyprenyl glycosylphosphotransferase n=1 Tax=unclassified Bradyrhizobium TaxID=2631580 RepID=UPI001BA69587|nr:MULTISPECIES: exopolysaccharide biosynthesis polyprenyl glycosylphosphotransferase [unclassified Bradyrhizobium]MBR1207457.1 exopolysaccharide biosynthesis polyprenyl glycosylphosphotransferase [Bradyrhizobium sp. AUGA SZCCT0124]MBR1315873.1 exopolysaccharide biosynthesis polyprenyl glycosylphosphotransferase [Bradyrhizobium sp. AUGA SZCCT0051]MBR1343979.1 exopolysaccharide biosynthesis polyprenyl glycosylphosphotransferase [Bradyrhizobium sp. AUGA SZCCT0105]MBR1358034.1 exopolysaccharide bi
MTNIVERGALLPHSSSEPKQNAIWRSMRASLPARAGLAFVSISIVEFTCVAMTAFASAWVYHVLASTPGLRVKVYLLASCFIGAAEVCIAAMAGQFLHLEKQREIRFASAGIGAAATTFVVLTSLLFIFKLSDVYSRGTLILQFVGCSMTVGLVRLAAYRAFQNAAEEGLLQRQRVVLVGRHDDCEACAGQLRKSGGGFDVVACPLGWDAASGEAADFDRATGAELVERCRVQRPDSIILLVDRKQEDGSVGMLLSLLRQIPADVYAVPTHRDIFWANAQTADIGGIATFAISRRPLSVFDLVVKRTFDIVAAAAGLIVLSPLLLLSSLAVKLDSRGPVLFVQIRHGYNNEAIRVLKFRTMYVSDSAEFRQASRGDSRVTRIGRIFRKTGIDELPQLWNILRGDMSVVGPRPHAITHNELFTPRIDSFDRRHTVKPGLTGWAQVNGFRGETNTLEKMQNRIEHDLYYIDNWSLLLDLKIILLTLFSGKTYRNAW